jgi:hypothetical protein
MKPRAYCEHAAGFWAGMSPQYLLSPTLEYSLTCTPLRRTGAGTSYVERDMFSVCAVVVAHSRTLYVPPGEFVEFVAAAAAAARST